MSLIVKGIYRALAGGQVFNYIARMAKRPAELVIEMFGIRPLARALDLTPGAVAHWRETGDVPRKYFERLLTIAKQRKVKLTLEMLVYGS